MFKLLNLFYIFLYTSLLCIITNKKFGECLPFSFIISALIVYIGGFLNDLRIGLIILLILPFVLIVLLFLKKKVNHKEYLKLIITPAFFVYIILSILIFIYHRYTTLNNFDEFAHWGVMIKEMFRLNKFYCVNESNLIAHKDYPPFLTIIQYIFLKLSRSYSEPSLYQSTSLFTFSLFMPLIDKYKKVLPILFISFFAIGLEFISFIDLFDCNRY